MDTSDREVIQQRTINAPRERVWEAWTNPEHIAQWWGPNGFTNTVRSMDVRPGGQWIYTMHGPDGTDYPNIIVYEKVVEPELLEYDHGDEKDGQFEYAFHVTTTFEDEGGKTKLTMHTVFPTAEALEAVKKFGAIEGGKQTIDRLEAYLPTMSL